MKRREFVCGLTAVVAWPHMANAQLGTRPTVGFVRGTPSAPFKHLEQAFKDGLKDEGFGENENVDIEYRYADGRVLARDKASHLSLIVRFHRFSCDPQVVFARWPHRTTGKTFADQCPCWSPVASATPRYLCKLRRSASQKSDSKSDAYEFRTKSAQSGGLETNGR